jgi:hypothetical protein
VLHGLICYHVAEEHRVAALQSDKDLPCRSVMSKITIIALVALLVVVSLSIGWTCDNQSETASVTEASAALKQCYILQHALDDPHAFDNFTIRDLQFGNKTTLDLSGRHMTVWPVKAKLYDDNGQYVQDLEQNLIKMDFGEWLCQ